nr:MAG TPA: hypothetical protein [Caudoviricetes sp.]
MNISNLILWIRGKKEENKMIELIQGNVFRNGAVIGSYKDIEDNEYNVYLIDRGGLKTKYQVRGFDNIYQVIIDHWWDYKDENSQRGNAD